MAGLGGARVSKVGASNITTGLTEPHLQQDCALNTQKPVGMKGMHASRNTNSKEQFTNNIANQQVKRHQSK